MANESQTLDEISRAAFALLLKEPFYAHILAGMPREVSDTVKSAGTAWDGQQVRLIVNPPGFGPVIGCHEWRRCSNGRRTRGRFRESYRRRRLGR